VNSNDCLSLTNIRHASTPYTRNSPGDEIANVNIIIIIIIIRFVKRQNVKRLPWRYTYIHIHALQNTIDSCKISATDRRSYVLVHRFTKFSEITQCNGHYAVQGHSRLPILVSIERSYTTSY